MFRLVSLSVAAAGPNASSGLGLCIPPAPLVYDQPAAQCKHQLASGGGVVLPDRATFPPLSLSVATN